jgi:hypothetical protein
MTDISDAADLIATAREALLSELLPALPKERRYLGLMIANAMAIAEREHRLGSDTATSEAVRLHNVLSASGLPVASSATAASCPDLTALRRTATAAIRAGHFDDRASECRLVAELLRTAADRVAISNPKALHP